MSLIPCDGRQLNRQSYVKLYESMKEMSLVSALRFLLALHQGKRTSYDNIDINQAWAAVETFLKTIDYVAAGGDNKNDT